MNEATRIAYDKMTDFLSLWPTLDIIALNKDETAPWQIQKIYDVMPIIDGEKRFRYKLIGYKNSKTLVLNPARGYHYPCVAPGQVLNDNRAGERFVERIAWTWNIFPEDFYKWFAFTRPKIPQK